MHWIVVALTCLVNAGHARRSLIAPKRMQSPSRGDRRAVIGTRFGRDISYKEIHISQALVALTRFVLDNCLRSMTALNAFAQILVCFRVSAGWHRISAGTSHSNARSADLMDRTKCRQRVSEIKCFGVLNSANFGGCKAPKKPAVILLDSTSAVNAALVTKANLWFESENPPAWFQLGAALVEMHNHADKGDVIGKLKRRMTLPGAPHAIEKALAAQTELLLESMSNPHAWFGMGAILLMASEYAEAERFFRASAILQPEDEMLSDAAFTIGGHSAAYYQGKSRARPPTFPTSLQLCSNQLTHEGFYCYAPQADFLFDEDETDRALMWSDAKAEVMSQGAIFKSKTPLLSPSDCRWVIHEVEKHAKQTGGWTTGRHVEVPTTDIPVFQVPAIRKWFDNQLQNVLFPMLHARYPTLIASPDELRVLDAFVVRYDAGAQASLPVHQDDSTFSFTIALNDQQEYDGGGTSFQAVRPVEDTLEPFAPLTLNADAGGVVAFPGKVQHGGNTITKGRRYIIALFIYADVNLSGRKPGYSLEMLNLTGAYPQQPSIFSGLTDVTEE